MGGCRTLLAYLALVAPLIAACGSGTPPPGPPAAGLVARPLPDDRFDGKVFWEFDASDLLEGLEVESYLWRFGGLEVAAHTGSPFRGYGRAGTYDVGLRATLRDGSAVEATASFTIDDLPYDFWGAPPEAVTVTAEGELRLVSAAEDGSAVGGEGPVVISGDGRYVTFYSWATNLGVDTGDDPWAWHYYRAENPLWEPLD